MLFRSSSHRGVFCPKNYEEGNNYPDVETTYIKAQYSGSENPIMSTILYPKNDSDITQQIPNIIRHGNGLKQIGADDFFYYQEQRSKVQFTSPNMEFNGELLFIRRNDSDSAKIEYVYLQDAQSLTFENNMTFQSTNPLKSILLTYSNASQISGYINGGTSQISIYCPFGENAVEMVKMDGTNTTFNTSPTESTVTFSISGPSSFVISSSDEYSSPEKNNLMELVPERNMPPKESWEIDLNVFSGLQHPYVLYNSTELKQIRKKVSDPSKSWYNWSEDYFGDISEVLSRDLEDYEDDQRRHAVYKLALNFTLYDGEECLNKTIEYLLDMGSITHYSSDLRRAKSVEAYAIAFDMIYQNLTSTQKEQIRELLYEHASPLKRMHLFHRNNHRVVDAGALGLTGLVLQDKEMIDIATETCLDYFYNQNPADGGSFEGYSYMAFALYHMSQFATGLRRLGTFDFYNDAKLLASFDYIAETLGPLGMPGSFEDCTFDKDIQEVLLFAAAQVNDTAPEKAQRYQYIWEQRQNNSKYSSSSTYGYLLGAAPSFHRILLYNVNETITAEPFESRKEVWRASSMAYLRTGGKDGLFMPFSCKDYDQNHPHQDENSFELWAYGAYILNNPGYPGWGAKFHTWSQSTEGANSLLIGGSDQLQVEANGLSSSISSPYFTTVIGDGTELYNDAGAFEYSPEPFILLYANIGIIFTCGLVYLFILRDISISMEPFDKLKEKIQKSTLKQKLSASSIKKSPSKLELLGMSFIHPFKIQEELFKERYFEKNWRFLNRCINLFIAGLFVAIFLICSVEINDTIQYHSQYHEDKYNFVFSLLPYILLLIFTLGPIIIGLLSYLANKIYTKSNTLIINKITEGTTFSVEKKKIRSLSSLSFLWIFPMIIFAGVLTFFTTVQSLNGAIHGLWTELNSINDVYEIMVIVLIEAIYNFGWIILFGIPFILLSISIFMRGVTNLSDGEIKAKRAWKIPLIGFMLIFVIIFLLYLSLYIAFKSIFSLITIEAIVN